MALPLFFIEDYDGTDFIMLDEDTSRHVVQVLRMAVGEALQLTDGKGQLLTALITEAHKKKCAVRIKEKTLEPRKDQAVTIAISLLKHPARFEWFIEKATEIGIAHIVPMICERTEKQHFRLARMRQVTISAMLQSHQYWLPKLDNPVLYYDLLQDRKDEVKLIAHCEEDQKQSIRQLTGASSIIMCIGPEGDFTPEEIAAALANGYTGVTLGQTRLRAETAGVVAAALLCTAQ